QLDTQRPVVPGRPGATVDLAAREDETAALGEADDGLDAVCWHGSLHPAGGRRGGWPKDSCGPPGYPRRGLSPESDTPAAQARRQPAVPHAPGPHAPGAATVGGQRAAGRVLNNPLRRPTMSR